MANERHNEDQEQITNDEVVGKAAGEDEEFEDADEFEDDDQEQEENEDVAASLIGIASTRATSRRLSSCAVLPRDRPPL